MKQNRITVALVIAVFLFNATCCTAKTNSSVSFEPESGVSSQAKTKLTLPHSLGLSGVANARDLGGYQAADGKTVKKGVLLRTAALHHATTDDIKILTEKYHLTQIIDFRTEKGISKNPDPVINGVVETSIPIHSSKGKTGGGDGKQSYQKMVTDPDSIAAFRQFFTVLLNHKDGAILFHCAAGKDRTGIASILLLSALGVDKNAVIQDYMLSNEYESSTPSKGECVKEEWAMTVFDLIHSQYGSMDRFLEQQLGLTPQNRDQLRRMYLS